MSINPRVRLGAPPTQPLKSVNIISYTKNYIFILQLFHNAYITIRQSQPTF